MTIYTMHEAKTNLSKIGKSLKNKEEEFVIVTNNGKPFLKIMLYENKNNVILGILKGKYKESDEPDWFNDDISKMFEGIEGDNLL